MGFNRQKMEAERKQFRMVWQSEDIERDWLGGARIAASPADVVAAFERCEHRLGREWIDNRRKPGEKGALPTLAVVRMGQVLASLDDVTGTEQLLSKIQAGNHSAVAELRAIYLLRSQESTHVELDPIVRLPSGNRVCDFRIRRNAEPWIYVEVTQPDVSDAYTHAEEVLNAIVQQVSTIKKPFSLEVFLRREPNQQETVSIIQSSYTRCSSAMDDPSTVIREELPDGLGLLILNEHPVGQFSPGDHGEEVVPRIGKLHTIVGYSQFPGA